MKKTFPTDMKDPAWKCLQIDIDTSISWEVVGPCCFNVRLPICPQQKVVKNNQLGGGFKYFLFSPLPGEMIQFDYYFSNGLKPPTSQS